MLTVGLLRLDVYISLYSLGLGLTKITPFCGNKRTFLQTPPPPIYRPAFHPPPPPPPKIKQPTCIFTGYHSRPTDELDTLSDSSSLPGDDEKKKKLCIVFELFCLVIKFMIWKRKKKEKKKKNLLMEIRIRTRKLWITKHAPYRWATGTNYYHNHYKICIYIQYGVSDHTTFDLCNPTIPILIKKALSNA